MGSPIAALYVCVCVCVWRVGRGEQQVLTYFLSCPSMAIAHLCSVSVHDPSKSCGCGHELRLFLVPGSRCLRISRSLNTTEAPPPAVGMTSPCPNMCNSVTSDKLFGDWDYF